MRALAAAPVFGIYFNLWSAYRAYSRGDFISAALDILGIVPGIGDAVDILRLVAPEGHTVTVQEERAIEQRWFERMHPLARQNFCAGNPGFSGCQ